MGNTDSRQSSEPRRSACLHVHVNRIIAQIFGHNVLLQIIKKIITIKILTLHVSINKPHHDLVPSYVIKALQAFIKNINTYLITQQSLPTLALVTGNPPPIWASGLFTVLEEFSHKLRSVIPLKSLSAAGVWFLVINPWSNRNNDMKKRSLCGSKWMQWCFDFFFFF